MLVAPEREAEDFYQPVLRMFKTNSKTQYMTPVLVQDEAGTWPLEVKYLCMNKTVCQGVLNILATGEYDLLHPEAGHAVHINRTGEGFDTKYSVLPSKDSIKVDYSLLEFEKPLAEYAQDLEASDREDKAEKVEEDFSF